MKSEPLYTLTPDGDEYLLSPAGVLILLAVTVYGDGSDCTPAGQRRGKIAYDAVIAAARKGGYMQCDILDTLLARGEVTDRVKNMARDACAAAGNAEVVKIVRAMCSNGSES